MLLAATALAALLLMPAASHAGGWATVGLSSMPGDSQPGEDWVVDLTVLQHGITPLENVEPRVLLESEAGGSQRTFAARPTRQPGVYRARVELPPKGVWAISVHDGFTGVHDFGVWPTEDSGAEPAGAAKLREPGSPPATGAGAPEPSGGDGGVALGTAIGLAALAGLTAAGVVAARRRREGPSPTGG